MDSVQRRRELIATGVAEHEVRQRLRRRELLPVRRGSYLLAADGPPSRPEERRRGAPAAARVADFADRRSMSVGESRSRIALRDARIPAPVLQWGVVSRDGMVLGEVDFGWPGLRTVGEFDGRVEYGRLLRSGQDPGDAVFAEKVREDAIRDEGLRVVR